MAKKRTVRMDQFTAGYICAVASLVSLHDVPAEAKDLLDCIAEVRWADLQEYDKEVFRQAGLRNCFYPKVRTR